MARRRRVSTASPRAAQVRATGSEIRATRKDLPAASALRRAARETRLVYFAMGKDDFLYARVAPTRALFDRVGIRHTYNESGGGHTWINWRNYLADFAPKLFR